MSRAALIFLSAWVVGGCTPNPKPDEGVNRPEAAATRPVRVGRKTARDVAVAFVEAVRSGKPAEAGLMTADPESEPFVQAMARAIGGITQMCDAMRQRFPEAADQVAQMDSAATWLEQVRRGPVDTMNHLVMVKADDPLFRIALRPVGSGWKVDVAASGFARDETLMSLASAPTAELARVTAREVREGRYDTIEQARAAFDRRLNGVTREGEGVGGR